MHDKYVRRGGGCPAREVPFRALGPGDAWWGSAAGMTVPPRRGGGQASEVGRFLTEFPLSVIPPDTPPGRAATPLPAARG
ncbi:hypothetical protein GCM10010249_19700 [Streptomyces roseolilacinus]|uniref:Uncharacterized protein n=1 Tax=Streptomyces roseolilacinus TaxID=66904 RepID=A0A918B0F4_9ACTN|nr:hypothetical protein GCM10010249_19700 [Streptomyces roseolilacinus]